MQTKSYSINGNLTLAPHVIKYYVDQFWNDVFTPIHEYNPNIHLMIMCKLQYSTEVVNSDTKTLGQMRMVNYSDNKAYSDYLISRLGILSDSYKDTPFNQISFTYFIKDGQAPESAKLLLVEPQYDCKAHSYNNAVLPISMSPSDYGQIEAKSVSDDFIRYVVSNKNFIY